MKLRYWSAGILLLLVVIGTGTGVAAWKYAELKRADSAGAQQPEPSEAITAAVAVEREHRRTTTSIGTVLALRSITLRNELAGTVRSVNLTPGTVVDEGTLLVALDVSVEEAELQAQQAQATLAESLLNHMQRVDQYGAAAPIEVDRARAERDIALAQMARARAIIARKTIVAPFRARVGMADVHPGQYLEEGTELTTLQGVDEALHVDFSVTQQVASGLREGDVVEILVAGANTALPAAIVAIDARVDPRTRNAWVRARVAGADIAPSPGASVRVRVPIGSMLRAPAVPISALRKGPNGDHVFLIQADANGQLRAQLRPVRTGSVLGDEVLIQSGVAAGDRVAATGSFKLRDGVLVAIAGEPLAHGRADAAATGD